MVNNQEYRQEMCKCWEEFLQKHEISTADGVTADAFNMAFDRAYAFAREYGEYVAQNPILAPIMKSDERRDICVRANANRAKDVIKWITDRYCLVEKSKAADLCRLTLEHSDSVDYGLIDGLTDIVCEIFHEIYHQVADNPDFGKEVES